MEREYDFIIENNYLALRFARIIKPLKLKKKLHFLVTRVNGETAVKLQLARNLVHISGI